MQIALILIGLFAAFVIFEAAIVPFQYWVASKIGCGYNPKTNRFIHGDFCQPKCWHHKYKEIK